MVQKGENSLGMKRVPSGGRFLNHRWESGSGLRSQFKAKIYGFDFASFLRGQDQDADQEYVKIALQASLTCRWANGVAHGCKR